MQEYLEIFKEGDYPTFINKYLKTKSLLRLKNIGQFCGCDYTNLYNPLFFYTRFDHSLVVSLMTWHFTHDKKATIVALLHDMGTPCFAHAIDFVLGDYTEQESSEKNIIDIIKKDSKLLKYLESDKINLYDFNNFANYPILENKSPKLCTDRLDGVLHTCYIWIHTHNISSIKEVYEDLTILENEDGKQEIGFKTLKIALKFVNMIEIYAKELQSNRSKYTTEFIAKIVATAISKRFFTLEDLYREKEKTIVEKISAEFPIWSIFTSTDKIQESDIQPNCYFTSYETKKRNVIPLVNTENGPKRIIDISKEAKEIYDNLITLKSKKYAYIDLIKSIK